MDKKFLMRLLAISSNFVWEMLVAILIGLFLGRILDRWLGFERLFVVILMILGMIGALRNFMVRVYRLGDKHNE